jgi:hypothetical protein
MTAPPNVVPIFATPFGVVTLAQATAANDALAALFTSRMQPAWRDPRDPPPQGAFRGRDDLTSWPEPAVRQLLREMLAGVGSVALAVSELSAEQFAGLRTEARAWFTVIGPDGYLPPHSHPNTTWAAVYCVAAPPPSPVRHDSGVLRLHEFRPGGMFMDSVSGTRRMPYRPGHCTWRPIAGQMAVFPASIVHEVALLRADASMILVTMRVRHLGDDPPWMPPW